MIKYIIGIMLLTTQIAFAQDVLVTNDGESLKVYNLEIGPSAIFYQLSQAEGAEIKRIAKSDVLIIRKADGTKIDPNGSTSTPTLTGNIDSKENTGTVSNNLQTINLSLIQAYNQGELRYKGTDTDKKASAIVGVLGLNEKSIIETNELAASFIIKKYLATHSPSGGKTYREGVYDLSYYDVGMDTKMNKLIVTLKNKTNSTIYIDLGNSFLAENSESKALYIPTATSTTSTTSSGASVNMGAVAGALGVGGSVGSLASGVNVGGGSSSATSKTTFSQRIVAIPPMSSKTLDDLYIGEGTGFVNKQWFFDYHILKPYASYFIQNGYATQKKDTYQLKDMNRGAIIDIPLIEGINPLSVFVTYSTNESFSKSESLRLIFFLKQIMFISDFEDVDCSQIPTVFLQKKIDRISRGIFGNSNY